MDVDFPRHLSFVCGKLEYDIIGMQPGTTGSKIALQYNKDLLDDIFRFGMITLDSPGMR